MAAIRQTTPVAGVAIVAEALQRLGVRQAFVAAGEGTTPLARALHGNAGIRVVTLTAAADAGYSAVGAAAAGSELGVCIASSSAATGLVPVLASALADSVPLLGICVQAASRALGTDAFGEVDMIGVAMPVTKHCLPVRDPADLARCLAAAAQIATTGRPGPVLVDVSIDVLESAAPFVWPEAVNLPGYRPALAPHGKQVQAAADLLGSARRPVLLVGGGAVRSRAADRVRQLVSVTGAPVVWTLMGCGVVADDDPRALGMAGVFGGEAAATALEEADLVVALGTRLSDRLTGEPKWFAPLAQFIHIDVDPTEISKVRSADVPIVGDLDAVLDELVPLLEESAPERAEALTDWWDRLDVVRDHEHATRDEDREEPLSPQFVFQRIGALSGAEAIYTSGSGQHLIWAARGLGLSRPGGWICSGGFGAVGFSIPAAFGASVAESQRAVWAIDGDQGVQVTLPMLAAAVTHGLPINVAIIDNGGRGLLSELDAAPGAPRSDDVSIPDFVKMAEAYGAVGLRVSDRDQVDPAIRTALATEGRPTVIHFVIDPATAARQLARAVADAGATGSMNDSGANAGEEQA